MKELLHQIWEDPFQYAVGLIVLLMAIGVVVRYGKEWWDELFG